jgi:L-ascorbate metabolism protein UlaG (beta-lactamase superfamily)
MVRRWIKRLGLGVVGLLALAIAVFVISGWRAFGQAATGERRARMERSPQWRGGAFENPQPLWNDVWGSLTGMMRVSEHVSPSAGAPVPVEPVDAARFQAPPPSGLRVTWLGHSTVLLEIDGHRVLTDPVFSPRASPLSWIGPQRWYAPPLPLAQVPAVDAVVISHDHYDHLDQPTIEAIKGWKAAFVVPLGVGAHLEYWGVPKEKIVELDWWEQAKVGDLEIHCVPARHASGRTVIDKDATLWAGYAFVGPQHHAYFSGDTGLFPAMEEIGRKLGPFDVTMIEVGQYNRAWPDWHIGPEQALTAHRLVGGKVFFPIHWGLFELAAHGWTEPMERALAAAEKSGAIIASARPGHSVETDARPKLERWWPQEPWTPGDRDPIVSTKVGGLSP